MSALSSRRVAREISDVRAARRGLLGRTLAARPTLVALVVLVLGALLLSAAHVRSFTELSPIDELQHIDYLFKAPHVVRQGERVGQEAMREEACRTLPAWPTPPCADGQVYRPEQFQEQGTNTAAVYTPLYYTLTRAVATPLHWVTGIDLVTAGRLVSGLWLAGGLVMTLFVARRFGAHPYPTAALLLAAAATPNVLLPAATVTPDAAALLAGAAMVWSVLWWEGNPSRRWWLPTLLAVAVVALKALNILVVAMVALYLVLRLLQRHFWPRDEEGEHRTGARHAWGSLGLAVGACVAALGAGLGYVVLSRVMAVASTDGVSMGATSQASVFPLQQAAEHLGVFLNVLYAPGWFVTTPLVGPLVQSVMGMVAFAGAFGAAFVSGLVPRQARSMAAALLVIGAIGAPLIIMFSYVSMGGFVPVPGRYALTLVPAALALTAAVVRRRAAQVVVTVGCLAMYLAVLGWIAVH